MSVVTSTELAEEAGVSYGRVRHWTDKQLLVYTRRDGRIRLYEVEENLRRIKFILVLQHRPEGANLKEIKTRLDAGDHQNDQKPNQRTP